MRIHPRRTNDWLVAVPAMVSCLFASVLHAQTPNELAAKAGDILKKRCHDCHGAGGKAEAGLYVLNYRSLLGRMIPKSAEESDLFDAVFTNGGKTSHRMPKDDEPLTDEEQQTLRNWIDEGAIDFNPPNAARPFITPSMIFDAVQKHLRNLPQVDRQFARYFTLTHLYNAGFTDEQLDTYRGALSKLVNSLSRGNRIVVPEPIDAAKSIFYVDLRNYEWDAGIWQKIAERDPYRAESDTPAATYCRDQTQYETPFVRGDWFVFAASKPPLYNDILQIQPDLVALQKYLEVEFATAIKQRKASAWGFNSSGVSKYANRMFIRFENVRHPGGYIYVSRDFAENLGDKNLFDHPLEHAEDGGEIIISLANGLQYYMLVDAQGKSLTTAPTNVVMDPQQRGATVVNGISCMSCHAQGLIPKRDQIRDAVIANPDAYPRRERDEILDLYKPADKLRASIQQDQQRFLAAVRLTGAPNTTRDPIVELARRFEDEVDLYLAASELGLEVVDFLKDLEERPELGRILGTLKVPGRTVKREVFIDAAQRFFNFSKGMEGKQTGEIREITLPGGVTLKQVWCPSGTFTMGTPRATEDEAPVQVTLTQGFWLGQTEITQAQWIAVMESSPWIDHGKEHPDRYKIGPKFPAVYVDSTKADAYCVKLTEIERKAGRLSAEWKYTLPTSAQWEYACRAGTSTTYSFGDDESKLGDYAWFYDNTGRIGETTAQEVGTKKPNGWGFFDMHGNVWEWSTDTTIHSRDGIGWRICRGGGQGSRESCHSKSFSTNLLTNRADLGFRVATVHVE